MAELALPRALHALGKRAVGEAVARRAGTVEAEHVLLAILARPTEPAAAQLAALGLDHHALIVALDAERQRSLGVSGIVLVGPTATATEPRVTTPGWGASVRDALRGANKPPAGTGRAGALEIELALAVLAAPLGTVPRALALAGIDRARLTAALAL